MQGRYFLPLLPLAMAALGGTIKRRMRAELVLVVLAIAEIAAILAIMPKRGL